MLEWNINLAFALFGVDQQLIPTNKQKQTKNIANTTGTSVAWTDIIIFENLIEAEQTFSLKVAKTAI